MSKPRPKKEDPVHRQPPKVKKLAKISSKSRLLANRTKRLAAKNEENKTPELLAITTG